MTLERAARWERQARPVRTVRAQARVPGPAERGADVAPEGSPIMRKVPQLRESVETFAHLHALEWVGPAWLETGYYPDRDVVYAVYARRSVPLPWAPARSLWRHAAHGYRRGRARA